MAIWLDLCLAGIALYLVKRILSKRNPRPYPPGPKPLPILGNMLDMPSVKPWVVFSDWTNKFGDMVHMEILNQHFVVLNSAKLAAEMLEKKGSIYSDRPIFYMAGELCGWRHSLGLLPYGNRLREYRKNFQRALGGHSGVAMCNDVEEEEMAKFLQRVLANPDGLLAYIRMTAGAIILRIAYGYRVQEGKDPFVDLAETAMDQFSTAMTTGAFMVDIIPILKYVPEWVPSAAFRRTAREWAVTLQEMVERPYKYVKDQMTAGIAPRSYTSDLLEGRALTEEEQFNIKWSASAMYAGGSDTTVSAIYSMFLALTLHPEVQRKAQGEVDRVVGSDRLPTFDDRTSLPYVEAVVKEVLRWNVVVPYAIPHAVSADDIHNGYFIPKGTTVLPNIWHMSYDPRTYSNPMEFRPERFLDSDGQAPEMDPRTFCFGFGRRICAGAQLADSSVWLAAAMTIAVFDVKKVVENGVEITPEVDPLPGLILHPKPFKCSIKSRSAKAVEIIQGSLHS